MTACSVAKPHFVLGVATDLGRSTTEELFKELLEQRNFDKLEHITVKVWITHKRRGDVEVELVSPNGVKSILAARRHGDIADAGYPGWTFMTVKHWYALDSWAPGGRWLTTFV